MEILRGSRMAPRLMTPSLGIETKYTAAIATKGKFHIINMSITAPVSVSECSTVCCLLHIRYFGFDCSLKSCPIGSNPDAPSQVDEIQMISCTSINSSSSDSKIQLTFRQQVTSLINSDISTYELKSKLEELSSVGLVDVQLLDDSADDKLCTDNGNAFLVTFLTNHGDLPMLGNISARKHGFTKIFVA